MSQLFPRSANATARMSLAAVLGLVLTGGWIVFTLMRSGWVTGQHEFVEQPVQFSHAHHVGGVGLDCRYCHTSVENSSFAGIPPTKTCMNCHSQIWAQSPYLEPVRESFRSDRSLQWTRVHDLPDFVYFDHSIHVNKGVGCETCHGRVDDMPLMRQASRLQMSWCLECHRNPEKFIRPREDVFQMGWAPPAGTTQAALGAALAKRYGIRSEGVLTSCSTCHR